jgi:hypothetical protein
MLEELFARFQFWRAKKIELGKDYDFFFDLSNNGAIAIKLLRKYPGVIVEFTNIHMSSDTHISYDQTIIANPNLCRTETEKFKNFTASIFRSIINSAVENALKESNENRNSNLVQSDSERTIHEEVVAVSEERVSNRKPRKKTVRRNKGVHSKVQQPSTDSGTGDQS